jgi:hypothetical protein
MTIGKPQMYTQKRWKGKDQVVDQDKDRETAWKQI